MAFFSAIDGDLGIIGGDTSAFDDVVTVVVPEPSTALLASLGLLALRRRRR